MPNNDEKKVLLKVTDLKQWFPLKKTKLFQKEQEYVRANDGNQGCSVHGRASEVWCS